MPAPALTSPAPARPAATSAVYESVDPALEPAVVWSDADGRPIRLVWAGARWRVTDRPTVITEPVAWWRRLDPDARALDRAPRECTGWRLQATADDGRSCILDIRDGGDPSRWFVVKVYD